MYIDTGGEPRPMHCPRCGQELQEYDEAIYDTRDGLAVGCEYCLGQTTAGQLAEQLEEVA